LKIQYKVAGIISLFGITVVCLLSFVFNVQTHHTTLKSELNYLKNVSVEVASLIESHIDKRLSVALTISSTPLIKDTLQSSNSELSSLPSGKRKQIINSLNQRWTNTRNVTDPFIQSYMTNSVANYLKSQQILLPGVYGEIFITNRYGALVATTGKLTTLAHANKYWWIASYNDGQGRIFLDDRGFDTSVNGYVLGIVIPIKTKDGKKIIGILKCNVNIEGPITHAIEEYNFRSHGKLKIVRTNGLIVREEGATPLTTEVDSDIVSFLHDKKNHSTLTSENSENVLMSTAPIPITMGSKKIGFGGSKKSIDHIKGNKGEGWHVVISYPEAKALEIIKNNTRFIFYAGLLLTVFTAFVSLILSRFMVAPIISLSSAAEKIGAGDLRTKAVVTSNDEIGLLAKSFNRMVMNLEQTMTSRDILRAEVKERKKTESEKAIVIANLESALKEIKTLQGIIPICSYCKKIRDDAGAWDIVEAYICKHSEAQFSHGICPECHEKIMDE